MGARFEKNEVPPHGRADAADRAYYIDRWLRRQQQSVVPGDRRQLALRQLSISGRNWNAE